MVSIGATSKAGPAWAVRSCCMYKCGASSAIAQALGGSAAARLSVKLGMPTSRDTFLRALRRLGSQVTMAPPAVVGIDDWAITRGHRCGTIVVDLERRCPIEVLDGRESMNVAEWLQRHPSIQVVARDRAGAYSDAAETAIPSAQQVADRWHLLVNLHETVERLLRRHTSKLREAAQPWSEAKLTILGRKAVNRVPLRSDSPFQTV